MKDFLTLLAFAVLLVESQSSFDVGAFKMPEIVHGLSIAFGMQSADWKTTTPGGGSSEGKMFSTNFKMDQFFKMSGRRKREIGYGIGEGAGMASGKGIIFGEGIGASRGDAGGFGIGHGRGFFTGEGGLKGYGKGIGMGFSVGDAVGHGRSPDILQLLRQIGHKK